MRLDPEAVTTVIVTTIKQTIAPLVADVAEMKAAIVTLGERAAVPGPPGPAGPTGDRGADGLGFDDVGVTYDGDRTVTVAFTRGDTVKAFPLEFPILRYRGAYTTGTDYRHGDVVMHGGSAWHCQATMTTVAPLDERDEWRLMVRRGRDGRDRSGART